VTGSPAFRRDCLKVEGLKEAGGVDLGRSDSCVLLIMPFV
jgi:hypothetical protein